MDTKIVREILTEDLDMRNVCAKTVLKQLAEEQKQIRVKICQDILVLSSQEMKHGSTNMTQK
jgi:hypothetical protein